jgi:hypothetical protein
MIGNEEEISNKMNDDKLVSSDNISSNVDRDDEEVEADFDNNQSSTNKNVIAVPTHIKDQFDTEFDGSSDDDEGEESDSQSSREYKFVKALSTKTIIIDDDDDNDDDYYY